MYNENEYVLLSSLKMGIDVCHFGLKLRGKIFKGFV